MRGGNLDRSQRFSVKPIVAMTEAKAANRPYFAVDDGELKLTIERSRLDLAPSRGIEKAG